MEERTRFIYHNGQRILLFDYSNLADSEETVEEIRKSIEIVAKQPPNSLYTLVNVENSRYDSRVIQALKELAAHNKPYVVAGAVYGMGAFHRVAYRMIMLFSKRNLEVFDDLEAAKNWLALQASTAA